MNWTYIGIIKQNMIILPFQVLTKTAQMSQADKAEVFSLGRVSWCHKVLKLLGDLFLELTWIVQFTYWCLAGNEGMIHNNY